MLSLLFTGWPPGVLGWLRGGKGRLLLLGLLPLLGRAGCCLLGSLGGRATTGAGLEVGLCVAALERPCDPLPAEEDRRRVNNARLHINTADNYLCLSKDARTAPAPEVQS